MNKNRRLQMNIPGLDKFTTIGATISDLKDRANQINSELRQIKLTSNAKRNELNSVLEQIEKMEKSNE